MYNDNKSKGFEIVSINIQYPNETLDETLEYQQSFHSKFTVLLNRTSMDVGKLYKVNATPTNIVIDRDGNIVTRVLGGGEENMQKIERGMRKAGLESSSSK